MNEPELPDELERLERALAGRPRPEPSADLRDRTLRLVEAELDGAELRRAEAAGPRAGGWLSFAVAAAATVLIWGNLSMSAAIATSYDLRLPADPHALNETVRQIRRLLPEMSEQESRRCAVILQGGAGLVPCPDMAPGPPARSQLNSLDAIFTPGE